MYHLLIFDILMMSYKPLKLFTFFGTPCIFWEMRHLHWRNFYIVCIILPSAHIKFYLFFSIRTVNDLISAQGAYLIFHIFGGALIGEGRLFQNSQK